MKNTQETLEIKGAQTRDRPSFFGPYPIGKNLRLFKSPFLEQFSYVHPIAPALLWGPILMFSFYWGATHRGVSLLNSFLMAFAGFMFWSLAEYLLHRFVFHFHPKGKIQERVAFLIHGIHHDDPNDARRLLMPPVAAIVIAFPFFLAFTLIFKDLGYAFFAGFLVGYLVYDYTHFAVHFWNFKSERFKALKFNHMKHHYSTPELRYGVSGLFWDKVFRTSGR
jgi:4-hydroxysphinganine ceramide fatty acyl 2-hydroxylase